MRRANVYSSWPTDAVQTSCTTIIQTVPGQLMSAVQPMRIACNYRYGKQRRLL